MDNIFKSIINKEMDASDVQYLTEAVYPSSITYLKMLTRSITLPIGTPSGKGNVCFLYSHSLSESVKLMTNPDNFKPNNRYYYYFYNPTYIGKIFNRRYRFRELEKRKDIYEQIATDTNGKIHGRKLITNQDSRNMYFELYRYLEIFDSVSNRFTTKLYLDQYWSFIKQILNTPFGGYNNKFVLVDLSDKPLKQSIRENLLNPLFCIYYTLFKRPELIQDLNIDFYFFCGRKVLKINPSTVQQKDVSTLRAEMKKMFSSVNKEAEIETAMNDENIDSQMETDAITHATINNIVDTVADDGDIIQTDEDLIRYKNNTRVEKEIKKKIEDQTKKTIDKAETDFADKNLPKFKETEVVDKLVDVAEHPVKSVEQQIDNDRELLEKIYYQNKSLQPIQKSSASTARDRLLREKQQDITIGSLTIKDLQKIKTSNIKIPEKDVSNVTHSSNQDIKTLRFENFDKTYNDTVLKKDIANAILALNDKSIPLFVRKMEVTDSSDELNYKETYHIELEDGNRKRHTINVDIPKFLDDKFLYIGGNKKIIKHQSFYLPIVKISPNMVQIVTNYSKMSIERIDGKSIVPVERLKQLIKKNEDVLKYFRMGSPFDENNDFVTTIEYDELAKVFYSFKCGTTEIFFSQKDAMACMEKNGFKKKPNYLFIGTKDNKPIFIDIDAQTTTVEEDKDLPETIIDYIVNALPEDVQVEFESVRAPKRTMFARVKVMEKNVSVAMLLGLWEGLDKLLKHLHVQYRLEDKIPRVLAPNEDFIKFKNTILVYKTTVPIELILNGFSLVNTEKYNIEDFNGKEPYLEYIKKVYGSAMMENALMNFYEFMIDPISEEILLSLNMPTNLLDVFIYAINMLSDSQFIPEINQNLARIRRNEIIPAILYERLAKNYVTYKNSAGGKKFTIPRDAVIKELLGLKTVEDYSTLNPSLEMNMLNAVSPKGFRGVNLDDAFTMARRAYDPSMTGIMSPNTSPDAGCGVARTLTVEPNIQNIRGIIKDTTDENFKSLHDANVFSLAEMTMPLCATYDDPNRLG